MASVEGIVLVVQESRFRLLTDDGRGALFVLAAGASLEAQDLPPLTHRRVRVDFENSRALIAGIAHDVLVLDDEGGRP